MRKSTKLIGAAGAALTVAVASIIGVRKLRKNKTAKAAPAPDPTSAT